MALIPDLAARRGASPLSFSIDTLSLTPQVESFSPAEFKAEIMRGRLLAGPLAVVFVRHGRSAGNERDRVAALGAEHEGLKEEYRKFHDHELPLVQMGREQARAAGRFLAYLVHAGLIPPIDRACWSPFERTKETLAGIVVGVREYCAEHGLPLGTILEPSAQGEITLGLSERYWHDFNTLPPEIREAEYEAREEQPLLWTPGGAGERMIEVADRARSFFSKLFRPSYAGKVILASTHGEFMNAAELICHELHPFGVPFKSSFATGIPNCGIYIFSVVPFAPAMYAPENYDLKGLQHYLKVAPYELSGRDARKFADWGAAPEWRERTSTRLPLADFPTLVELNPQAAALAQKLADAGVGTRPVRSRA